MIRKIIFTCHFIHEIHGFHRWKKFKTKIFLAVSISVHIFLLHNPSVYRTPPSFRQNSARFRSIRFAVQERRPRNYTSERACKKSASTTRCGIPLAWDTGEKGKQGRQGENKVPLARRSEPIFIKVSDSIKRLGWFLEGISTLHPMGIGGDRRWKGRGEGARGRKKRNSKGMRFLDVNRIYAIRVAWTFEVVTILSSTWIGFSFSF